MNLCVKIVKLNKKRPVVNFCNTAKVTLFGTRMNTDFTDKT